MQDDQKDRCPLCGTWRPEPRPHYGSTSWSDNCACSDLGPCVAHEFNPEDSPSRPSDHDIEIRAEKKTQHERERWKNLMKRFEDYRKWAKRNYSKDHPIVRNFKKNLVPAAGILAGYIISLILLPQGHFIDTLFESLCLVVLCCCAFD